MFIKSKLWLVISQTFYKFLFGEIGRKSRIISPMQIDNQKKIYIKNNVLINGGGVAILWI